MVRVGVLPAGLLSGGVDEQREMVARIADAGIDHVGTGDHVSFFGGFGDDGLVRATALLAMHPAIEVHLGVYLLPLRHPVTVARQVATMAQLAPGRLVLGVGIGGEDPHELEICGVDPRTRGRRMDESLACLRGLLTGEPVTHEGRFFSFRDAIIAPAPRPPVPLVVGGRSDAAVRRVARLGDGWLAIWVSPERFGKEVARIGEQADAAGRTGVAWRHGLQLWCGIGQSPREARDALAPAMEGLYRTPFERFERYSPCGTPADVADALAPFVGAGCTTFNLIPRAADPSDTIDAVAEVRRLLA
jgi:alkanesulfonate monooxygenase SsuD/methylene tetrahydromethanopterin reductase-like flavin-dependent oxidoreductase (luciferase family)